LDAKPRIETAMGLRRKNRLTVEYTDVVEGMKKRMELELGRSRIEVYC